MLGRLATHVDRPVRDLLLGALLGRELRLDTGFDLLGSEVASAAPERGLPVTAVEALPTPLERAVGTAMGTTCASLHTANGTDLRCGVAVVGLVGEGSVCGVRLSDGSIVYADLVVIGTGAVPATDWLADSGLTLDNGVVCDETLHTGPPGVYAASDVARWQNPLFGRQMRLEHWTSAAEQGAIAARNALDPTHARPYETVPYFWSDWYDTRIQFVGVPDAEQIGVIGDADKHRFVAVYRAGDRVVGALALNRHSEIMKYRALIKKRVTWTEALEFATETETAKRPATRDGSPGVLPVQER